MRTPRSHRCVPMGWISRIFTTDSDVPGPGNRDPEGSSGPAQGDSSRSNRSSEDPGGEPNPFPRPLPGVRNLDARGHLQVSISGKDKELVFGIGRSIRSSELKLPPMPSSALKVLQVLEDPDASAQDVVQLISTDPILTAEILRTANSARYAGRDEVTNVQIAVVRIGLRALQSIVLGASLHKAMRRSKSLEAIVEEVWRQTASVGALARAIASETGVDPDQGFLHGTMHDLGKVPLLALLGKRLGDKAQAREEIVAKIFFLFHEKAGQMLAEKWDLPAEIASIAGCHHHFERNTEHPRLAALVSLAHRVDLCLSLGDEAGWIELHGAEELGILGIPPLGAAGLLDRALGVYLAGHPEAHPDAGSEDEVPATAA